MAGMNWKQIADRLNAEFVGDTRKLVFWYDANGDFAEDIDDLELENAKIYHLEKDNQFYTKYFLERVDTTTNYLLYAPFPKPDVLHNHLEDTVLYSRQFHADRASLLLADLGIAEQYRPILEAHSDYFSSKERTQRFYDLEIETYNEETILTGLICAVCRTHIASLEEALRVILTEGTLTENKYLEELQKYRLIEDFWQLISQHFGYSDETPTLRKLVLTMFATAAARTIPAELPWVLSPKSGNIAAFLDSLMNNVLCQEQYDALSDFAAKALHVETVFASIPPEELVECGTFLEVDRILVRWLTERLLSEDLGAKLNGLTIPEVCEKRRKLHFGSRTQRQYLLLENAFPLVQAASYAAPDGDQLFQTYLERDYAVDQAYRKFYTWYDALDGAEAFQRLRQLVENIYANEYLAKLLPCWNARMQKPDSTDHLPLQRDFYRRYVRPNKSRTVVIISDAMRYETAEELYQILADDPRCTVKLDAMVSVLPSYTQLGMAALLPHRALSMTEDFQIRTDDKPCDDLKDRQAILQSYCEDSCCVLFDEIKSMKQADLRKIFSGKQVVYVYHNQIDARGDKANTEDEVFTACAEAVQEISELIHRLSVSANTGQFIVTADHGFLYKRDKLEEYDKIERSSDKNSYVNRRFIVSEKPIPGDGIESLPLGGMIGNHDERAVSFPIGSQVFKTAGGGQNYVHGGSSPQEMIVPLLDIKTERKHIETRPAEIQLVTQLRKVTNLMISLQFHQTQPVGDKIRSARYRLYFISEDNQRISNEVLLDADSRAADVQKRMFQLRFTFKNQKYDSSRPYYLISVLDDTEVWRHPVIMDLACCDDFGF